MNATSDRSRTRDLYPPMRVRTGKPAGYAVPGRYPWVSGTGYPLLERGYPYPTRTRLSTPLPVAPVDLRPSDARELHAVDHRPDHRATPRPDHRRAHRALGAALGAACTWPSSARPRERASRASATSCASTLDHRGGSGTRWRSTFHGAPRCLRGSRHCLTVADGRA